MNRAKPEVNGQHIIVLPYNHHEMNDCLTTKNKEK